MWDFWWTYGLSLRCILAGSTVSKTVLSIEFIMLHGSSIMCSPSVQRFLPVRFVHPPIVLLLHPLPLLGVGYFCFIIRILSVIR